MNKRVLGLPLYLWVGTIASATAILYFYQQHRRQKAQDQAAQDAQGLDPSVCDPTSDSYDAEQCAMLTPETNDISDSGDPCDPSSVNYDPVACEADAGLALSYGQSPGGIGGFTGGGPANGSDNFPPVNITFEPPASSSGNTSGDTLPPKGTHGKKPKNPHKVTGGGHKRTGPRRQHVTARIEPARTAKPKAKPKKRR